jgi:hypothetical protein
MQHTPNIVCSEERTTNCEADIELKLPNARIAFGRSYCFLGVLRKVVRIKTIPS